MSYLLLCAASPQFGDPGLTQDPAARATLSKAVAALVAPGGGDAVNQTQALARFNIGYVLMPAPASNALATVLNGVAGLTQVSINPKFDLWKLSTPPAGIRVVETSGKVDPIASGATGVTGAKVPAAGGILELPEPSGGWTASVNGHVLTPVASPAGKWSQAFTLPGGGGTVTIGHSAPIHGALTLIEILLFVLVAGLALPGVRTAAEIEAAAAGINVDDSADVPAVRPAGGRGDQGSERPDRAAAGAAAGVGASAHSGQPESSVQAVSTLTSATAASRGRAAALSTDDATVVAGRAPRSSGSSDRPGARQSGERSGQSGDGADGGNRLQRGRAAAKRAARFGRGKAQAEDDRGREETRVAGRRSGLPLPARSSSNADSRSANGATQDGRRSTPPRRSEAPGDPAGRRAAWPAGQPASRFLDGPPSRSSEDDEYGGRGRRATPPGGPPAGARSPSGTPFDEPSGYDDARGYGDERGYGDARGHSRRLGHGDEPGYRAPPSSGPDSSVDGRRERDTSERRSHRRQSRGRSRDDAGRGREPRSDPPPPTSGRPSRSQRSWSQDQQDGWPQYGEQRQAQWQVPGQQQWPDQGGALEALPPDEEHHDWPAGDERGSRNWHGQGSDGEGESW